MDMLSIKGIVAGTVAFAVFYALYALASSWMVSRGHYSPWLVTIGGYLVWLLSGFVAGAGSRRAGLLNGAVTGLLTPLVMALYLVVGMGGWAQAGESILSGGLYWLATGVILCGLGGLLWDLQRKAL